MVVQPYLFFNGRCEEAVNFYAKALGTKVDMLMRFKESPEPPQMQLAPGSQEKVVHASLHIGDTVVMAGDGMMAPDASFKGFALVDQRARKAHRRQVLAPRCRPVARPRCRWPRPSGRRTSACSPTSSASTG